MRNKIAMLVLLCAVCGAWGYIADTSGVAVIVIRENEIGMYDRTPDTLVYAQEFNGVIHCMNIHKEEYTLRPPKEFYRRVR